MKPQNLTEDAIMCYLGRANNYMPEITDEYVNN
jgi:hypothetical protein